MAFMIDKFKGKYRLKVPIDASTNDFAREPNGSFAVSDIYIDCANGIQISYYGNRGTLEAYIPSLGRGRNIIKAIYSEFVKPIEESEYYTSIEKIKDDGEIIKTNLFDYDALYKDSELNKIIHSIVESDEEVSFRFKWTMMEQFEKYFKPKTSAASRSPFSTKNLPRSDYEIPEEDLNKYKEVASKLPKEDVLKIGFMTKEYIKSIATRKNKIEDIKSDMKKKCLKGKEYIHSIGRWDDYLKYLEKEIEVLIK